MPFYRIEVSGWKNLLLQRLAKKMKKEPEELIIEFLKRSLLQVESELSNFEFKKEYGLNPILEVHLEELKDPRKHFIPEKKRYITNRNNIHYKMLDALMAPDFPKGTWIFCDGNDEVQSGDLAYYKLKDGREGFRKVFISDDGLTVRFEFVSRSRNAKWENFELARFDIRELIKFKTCVLSHKRRPNISARQRFREPPK